MVSQYTFKGQDWRENPHVREKMFRVFPIMDQLYEMIAYVSEAMSYQIFTTLFEKLKVQLKQLQNLIRLDADQLLSLDISSYRLPVNELLLETSEFIRKNINVSDFKKPRDFRGVDWIGKKLKGKDLRGITLRGAYLIAADLRNTDLRGVDLIGGDLRDADLSGANLSTSLFLTQMQMNSAKGNKETKLPYYLKRPAHWND